MPAYETFALGGPLRLSGFRLNQFSGRDYVFGRVMYYNRIFPLPEILGKGVFAGASAEVGNIRNRADGLPSPGTQYSGSLFLGADTAAGPGYLGVGLRQQRRFQRVPVAGCAVTPTSTLVAAASSLRLRGSGSPSRIPLRKMPDLDRAPLPWR